MATFYILTEDDMRLLTEDNLDLLVTEEGGGAPVITATLWDTYRRGRGRRAWWMGFILGMWSSL